MNETLQTIQDRYSCRNFTGEAIAQDRLEAIALAGLQAPSAMNMQPWEIMVIRNKDLIDEMDEETMKMLAGQADRSVYERIQGRGGRIFYNAPCMFLVAKKPGSDLDCGIVTENIALAASSLGIGNVICGLAALIFQTEKGAEYKARLIPEGYEFGVAILVGYEAGEGKLPHEVDSAKIKYVD